MATSETLFVADLYGGSQPEHRVNVRVINEFAWHNLFIRTMLVRPEADELPGFVPEFTIIDLPSFRADPERHGCRSETVIAVNLEREADPDRRHRICRRDEEVRVRAAQLSCCRRTASCRCTARPTSAPRATRRSSSACRGTGKTTLSADPNRTLIGDDEHGWSDTAVFNFEGGCYAKMIRLSAEGEPEIYATTKRFGTVLENVVMDPVTRELDLDDDSLAENSRGAYPIDFIPNSSEAEHGAGAAATW